jgi:hypothetical protein
MHHAHARQGSIAAGVVALLCAVAPGSALGATTIGQAPPPGVTEGCDVSTAFFVDIMQLSSATGNPYVVPAGGGVITSWNTGISPAGALVKLRTYSGAGLTLHVAAESEVATLAAPLQAFPTRIKVAGGQLIGLSLKGVGATPTVMLADCDAPSAPSDVIGLTISPSPVGSDETVSTAPGGLISVSAKVEPDADGDGFGDETQDSCASSALTQGACPPPCGGLAPTQIGTANGDAIKGTKGKDVIVALGSDDVVKGRGGNDVICGGDGNDELNGGSGKDKLFGDAGKDKLVGGSQSDLCNGGAAKDKGSGCEKGPDS